jgi:hypothetical protein
MSIGDSGGGLAPIDAGAEADRDPGGGLVSRLVSVESSSCRRVVWSLTSPSIGGGVAISSSGLLSSAVSFLFREGTTFAKTAENFMGPFRRKRGTSG